MARYKLKFPFSERSCLPCAFGGEVIDLSGRGYEKMIPTSIRGPERTEKVRGATQKDLKKLFEAGGHLHLICIVEKKEERDVSTN